MVINSIAVRAADEKLMINKLDVMQMYIPRKYGHPRVPILRDL